MWFTLLFGLKFCERSISLPVNNDIKYANTAKQVCKPNKQGRSRANARSAIENSISGILIVLSIFGPSFGIPEGFWGQGVSPDWKWRIIFRSNVLKNIIHTPWHIWHPHLQIWLQTCIFSDKTRRKLSCVYVARYHICFRWFPTIQTAFLIKRYYSVDRLQIPFAGKHWSRFAHLSGFFKCICVGIELPGTWCGWN